LPDTSQNELDYTKTSVNQPVLLAEDVWGSHEGWRKTFFIIDSFKKKGFIDNKPLS